MTPKQKVMALAKEIGSAVEAESDSVRFIIRAEAPQGKHWCEGVHELVEGQFRGFGTSGLWNEMLIRMKDGFEPCTAECEWWEE